MFGRPDRVMRPASAWSSDLSAPPSTTIMLPAPIVNCQHVTAFAAIEPDRLTVMFPLKLNEALEYQTETVAASAAALMAFVYSRAFVQVLPAASVMDEWSFVFPSVVARLSVARTITPTLPAVSWAEVANVHDVAPVPTFGVQKELPLAKAAHAASVQSSRLSPARRTDIGAEDRSQSFAFMPRSPRTSTPRGCPQSLASARSSRPSRRQGQCQRPDPGKVLISHSLASGALRPSPLGLVAN